MASYELTRKIMLHKYPTLFSTEFDVLHHLFFVLGNGYRWANGELIKRELILDGKLHEKTIEEWEAELADKVFILDEKLNRVINRLGILRSLSTVETPHEPTDKYPLYPLSDHCGAVEFPDDIKPDWLEALKKAIELAEMDSVIKSKSDIKYLNMIKLKINSLSGKV